MGLEASRLPAPRGGPPPSSRPERLPCSSGLAPVRAAGRTAWQRQRAWLPRAASNVCSCARGNHEF